MTVKLNDKFLKSFVSEEEIKAEAGALAAAHEKIVNRSGEGSDFLGWYTLPNDYDKEEFARIKKAAKKIQETSEVLVVIGIGGSYLGRTRSYRISDLSQLQSASQKDAEHLFCRQFHQRADAYRGRQASARARISASTSFRNPAQPPNRPWLSVYSVSFSKRSTARTAQKTASMSPPTRHAAH